MFSGFKLYNNQRQLIGYIKDVVECTIEKEINVIPQMLLEAVLGDLDVRPGMYIEWDNQYYIIQTVSDIKDYRGTRAEILAEHAIAELRKDIVVSIEMVSKTAAEALTNILAGNRFGWTVGTVQVTTTASVSKHEYATRLELLMKVPEIWGGIFEFDSANRKVNLYSSVGTNKGVIFSYKRNLQEVQRTIDFRDFGTRLYALGRDNITTAPVNGTGNLYIDADTVSVYGIHDYVWKTEITNAEQLYQAALVKLQLIKHPRVSYSLKATDLSFLSGMECYNIGLGDIVKVKDEDIGFAIESVVVKIIEHPVQPKLREITIDSVPLSYRDIERRLAALLNTVEDNKDIWDKARILDENIIAEYGMKDYGLQVEFIFSNQYHGQPVIFVSLQKNDPDALDPTEPVTFQSEPVSELDSYNNIIFTGATVKVISGPGQLPGYKINLLAFCMDPVV